MVSKDLVHRGMEWVDRHSVVPERCAWKEWWGGGEERGERAELFMNPG